MVTFLSMFCPGLQKLLKPTFDFTWKGKPFVWGKEQQDSFEEIKHRFNIASFSHLLKRVYFDAIIDHLSLTHIIKSKADSATIRIKSY